VANAFTVDFEDWYQGLQIPPEEWDGFEDRIPDSGRWILSVLAEAGVRETFFVLGGARSAAAAGVEGAAEAKAATVQPRVFRPTAGR
jgi:hypothetical protein